MCSLGPCSTVALQGSVDQPVGCGGRETMILLFISFHARM